MAGDDKQPGKSLASNGLILAVLIATGTARPAERLHRHADDAVDRGVQAVHAVNMDQTFRRMVTEILEIRDTEVT